VFRVLQPRMALFLKVQIESENFAREFQRVFEKLNNNNNIFY